MTSLAVSWSPSLAVSWRRDRNGNVQLVRFSNLLFFRKGWLFPFKVQSGNDNLLLPPL
jgi:hypothetical protein